MAGSTLRFPENISGQGTYMILTRYQSQGFNTSELRSIDTTILKASPAQSIGLPIPNTFIDGVSVNYSDIQDSDIAGMVQTNLINRVPDLQQQQLKLSSGSTDPKQAAMLFNSVSAKNYTFSWELIPETQAEANSIISIIKTLEEAQYPYYSNNRLMFPDIIKVSFGGVKPKLINFLPCYITNIEKDFSGSGHFQMYSDGSFPVVKLSISLIELVSRTREIQKRVAG